MQNRINLANAKMVAVATHHVGNANVGGGLFISQKLTSVDHNATELLSHFFLSSFKTEQPYAFTHIVDLSHNPIFNLIQKAFETPENSLENSGEFAQILFDRTLHPNIKEGEFYFVFYDHCVINDEVTQAIGLYKSETKDTFLKPDPSDSSYTITADVGINTKKLDKGCLIFNTDSSKGYIAFVIDQTNKGDEAKYWKEDFLQLTAVKESYFYTDNYLDMCNQFISSHLPNQFDVERTDQIDMLNRSMDFFKKHDKFDFNTFSDEVIRQPELAENFIEYKNDFQEQNHVPLVDEFEISGAAVKKHNKVFKSVVKLDKNFHIYIHGNKNMIEKGVDEETGMKFYKLFFKEEN